MLGSCCACAKGTTATAVTRTARRALPLELGIRKHDQKTPPDEERSTGSARERHGLFRFGAFQAARIRRPSIQYSRVVLPPGPNSWRLNVRSDCSVPSTLPHPPASPTSVARCHIPPGKSLIYLRDL